MEFWGVEVKSGQTVKCEPGEDKLVHLSQAAIGESKDKGSENVTIYVKHNNQKLVIGTLSAEKCAQISYDLVFEKDFELSHSSKNATVHFCGYQAAQHVDEMDGEIFSGSDSEEEVDVPNAPNANGKPKDKVQGGKPIAAKSTVVKEDNAVGNAKAKSCRPIKAVPKADDEDEDEDDDSDDEDFVCSDDDEDMMEVAAGSDEEDDSDDEDGSDDEDDESSEEEEATPPKKSAKGKRAAESALKTPVPEKKAKLVTPAGQKTGGGDKKNAHVATPHPAKQAGKTPANSGKATQSPKSAGSFNCESCGKTFTSDTGRQAHTKAKHSAAAAK